MKKVRIIPVIAFAIASCAAFATYTTNASNLVNKRLRANADGTPFSPTTPATLANCQNNSTITCSAEYPVDSSGNPTSDIPVSGSVKTGTWVNP